MGLHLLLLILKIVVFIILGVFAIITLALLLILFVPFRYRAYAEKYEKISGKVSVSWLFGGIAVVYEADGSGGQKTFIRILGIKKTLSQEEPAESGNTPSQSERSQTEVPPCPTSAKPTEHAAKNLQKPPPKAESAGIETNKTVQAEERPRKDKRRAKKRKAKPSKEKKSKSGEGGLLETLKQIWEFENKAAIMHQCILLAKRIFKIIFNFRVKADIRFGTGSPDTTGYLLGLCYAASCVAGIKIDAEGDFENTSITGRAEAKGGLFICGLFWAIILFVLNKNIFRLIKKYVFKKG